MAIIKNTLIKAREKVIHKLFRVSESSVFNPVPCPNPPASNREIAAEIKQAINRFKIEAIDSQGFQVDYSRIENSSGYDKFNRDILPQLHHFDHSQNSDNQQAASFWINLYNALVIHAVIALNVENSVMEHGFGGMIRFFRGAAYQVGDFRFSLEDIEHGVLRNNAGNPLQISPQFAGQDPRVMCALPIDPRIHFALNCASKSCPPISVYTPEQLDQQLDLASANYINQETKLVSGKLYISKLFSWYQTDFGGRRGVTDFLLANLPDDPRRAFLRNNPGKFHYSKYDWGLNY